MGGPCHYIQASTAVQPGFEMVATGPRYDTPDTKAAALSEAAAAVLVGTHYCLKPLKRMKFEEYDAEVQRLYNLGIKCDWKARASDDDLNWPPEYVEPNDALMAWVARAMYILSKSDFEDDNDRLNVGSAYATICALNMSVDELLGNYTLSSLALRALETFQTDDVEGESHCNAMAYRIRHTFDTADDYDCEVS